MMFKERACSSTFSEFRMPVVLDVMDTGAAVDYQGNKRYLIVWFPLPLYMLQSLKKPGEFLKGANPQATEQY